MSTADLYDIVKLLLAGLGPLVLAFCGWLVKEMRALQAQTAAERQACEAKIEAVKDEHAAAMESLRKEHTDAMERLRSEKSAKIEALRTAHQDHKVEVARDYVSRERFEKEMERLMNSVAEIKADVKASMARLGEKIDRLVEKR